MDRPEVVFRHMSVHLCGREVCVSEQFLNRSEIGPTLQKVRGKGMAEGVRVQRAAVGEL